MSTPRKILFAIGLSLTFAGGFLLGRALSPLVVGPLALVGALIVVLTVGQYRWRLALVAAVAAIVALMAGNKVGKLWLYDAIRSELPMLNTFTLSLSQAPDIREVPQSRLFLQAFVRTEKPPLSRMVVAFPLDDGSVVEFVRGERAHYVNAPCMEEIEPGWYRRFRCARD